MKPRSRRAGWVTAVLTVVVASAGFVVACLASLVARIVWRVDPVAVPWGLVLAVGGSASLVVLARTVGRSAGFAAAGGWLVGLFYVFSPRSEGDYIIADDGLGYSYLLLSVLAVMIAAAWGAGS
ncbi:MAG: hypothetical protein ACRDO2_05585 [Nocardioidaceae bacterium]